MDGIQVITVYLKIRDRANRTVSRWQNGEPNGLTAPPALEDGRITYHYLPFIYSGGTKTKTGDNISATLAMATNKISVDVASDYVLNRYLVNVYMVRSNPENMQPLGSNYLITSDVWSISSMAYDTGAIELVLNSSIDAIGAQFPRYVLDRVNVGTLPTSANVRLG